MVSSDEKKYLVCKERVRTLELSSKVSTKIICCFFRGHENYAYLRRDVFVSKFDHKLCQLR